MDKSLIAGGDLACAMKRIDQGKIYILSSDDAYDRLLPKLTIERIHFNAPWQRRVTYILTRPIGEISEQQSTYFHIFIFGEAT